MRIVFNSSLLLPVCAIVGDMVSNFEVVSIKIHTLFAAWSTSVVLLTFVDRYSIVHTAVHRIHDMTSRSTV